MARPKGVTQKRDETKYWLPSGVKLASNAPDLYRKNTKLTFIDEKYGEFISTFKALQDANASTHKKSVQDRREATNEILFGGKNPSNSRQVREKAEKTMVERFGVKNALENPVLFKKSRDTLEKNFGVREPMKSSVIKETLRKAFLENYGVYNPMLNPEILKKVGDTNEANTGYRNPGQNPASIEKAFITMSKNGSSRYSSSGELELLEYIKSLGIEAYKGFFGGANPKEIDIKIPELNIAIEYNGSYWHKDKKNYHKDKMLIAKENGYKLLQFWDFEWKNKNTQIKSFLRSALKKNEIKINGRQTVIKEVDKDIARRFLNTYHILGCPPSFLKALGLYYKDDLVAMITIGYHHRTGKELLLSRYVGKENITVRGGLNKLCKAAFKEFGQIATFIDLRMSDGSSWLKNGWKFDRNVSVEYMYYDPKKKKAISKSARRKKTVGTPEHMTEAEHAKIDGLHRLYDCGKLKLKYTGE